MINLALIGAGKWGQNYIKIIKGLPGVKLVYICAQHKEVLSVFSTNYKVTTDYRDVYQDKDVNAIIIATPASTHFSVARDFLEKGYNLLIEKPLTINYSNALTLQNIYDSKKNIVLVGHIFQYHPAFLKAKEYLAQIGRIIHVDFEWTDWGPFRKDVSALWDWAPHPVGMCFDILGFPKTVFATGFRDMNIIDLSYESGVHAFIKIGCLSPVGRRRMTIVGDKGLIIFDDLKKKKVKFISKKSGINNILLPKYSKLSPLKRQILEFVGCIGTGKIPITDITFGVKIIKIIQFVQESLDKGRIVITS